MAASIPDALDEAAANALLLLTLEPLAPGPTVPTHSPRPYSPLTPPAQLEGPSSVPGGVSCTEHSTLVGHKKVPHVYSPLLRHTRSGTSSPVEAAHSRTGSWARDSSALSALLLSCPATVDSNDQQERDSGTRRGATGCVSEDGSKPAPPSAQQSTSSGLLSRVAVAPLLTSQLQQQRQRMAADDEECAYSMLDSLLSPLLPLGRNARLLAEALDNQESHTAERQQHQQPEQEEEEEAR